MRVFVAICVAECNRCWVDRKFHRNFHFHQHHIVFDIRNLLCKLVVVVGTTAHCQWDVVTVVHVHRRIHEFVTGIGEKPNKNTLLNEAWPKRSNRECRPPTCLQIISTQTDKIDSRLYFRNNQKTLISSAKWASLSFFFTRNSRFFKKIKSNQTEIFEHNHFNIFQHFCLFFYLLE